MFMSTIYKCKNMKILNMKVQDVVFFNTVRKVSRDQVWPDVPWGSLSQGQQEIQGMEQEMAQDVHSRGQEVQEVLQHHKEQ